jgi:hypothetical protein
VSLTAVDAAVVKGMLARGDRQHDIASWFGVNGGRIAEIAARQRFKEVPAAAWRELPPRGPIPEVVTRWLLLRPYLSRELRSLMPKNVFEIGSSGVSQMGRGLFLAPPHFSSGLI